jgi:PKD repeat protein
MVAGCGGGATDPVNPNPPPSPPPAILPATVAVESGDNQEAEPGAAVALRPAVVVRSASGAPAPGVMVSFRVDSGGGTLSAATAVTGANGIAAAGDWILGPAEGVNVITATAGNLSPAKFRAQGKFGLTRTLIAPRTVDAAGATLGYARPGDPLSGLELVIPKGSYKTASTWSIVADSSITVPLPAEFSQVGPVLTISNGQGYSDSLMALTIPLRVGPEFAVAPFFFDPATGTLEGIPLLARSDSSITLASRHFSGDQLAIPQAALRASVRASAQLAFGTIKMVFVKIPLSSLSGTFTSSFLPGQDDWEFPNNGDYQGPHGDCEGMSVTAVFYHYFFRSNSAPPLFHQFDRYLTNDWDGVDGIHLVGAVQADYLGLIEAMKAQKDLIRSRAASIPGQTVEGLASTWILLNLKLTQKPLVLGMFAADGSGHAVVVYQATGSSGSVVVQFADPNSPGVGRSLTYQNGNLQPVSMQTIASGPPGQYITSSLFGITSDIPLSSIKSRWAEFTSKAQVNDHLPGPRFFEVFDSLGQTWSPMPDIVRLVEDTLKLRVHCPACHPEIHLDIELELTVFDAPGTTKLATGVLPAIPVQGGTSTLFVMAGLVPDNETATKFLDGKFVTVQKVKLGLTPLDLVGSPNIGYDYVLSHDGAAPSNARYIWDFGDGTAVQTVTGDSTITHGFTKLGTHTVRVELRDGSGKLLGSRTTTATIQDVRITIAPSPLAGGINQPVTLTARNQNPGTPAGLIYEWDFGDHTTASAAGDSTVTKSWAAAGAYAVKVVVKQALAGPIVAQATATATITAAVPIWRFTVMNEVVTGTSFPDYLLVLQGYIGQDINSLMEPIWAVPRTGLLFYFATPTSVGGLNLPAGVYVSANSNTSSESLNPQRYAPLARPKQATYPDAFEDALVIDAATQAGNLSSGTFGGTSATHTRDLSGFRGVGGIHTVTHWQVTATKNGTQLTGTITYYLEQWSLDGQTCIPLASLNCVGKFFGTLKWNFPFTAVRVR